MKTVKTLLTVSALAVTLSAASANDTNKTQVAPKAQPTKSAHEQISKPACNDVVTKGLTYVYVEEGTELSLKDGTIVYSGTPLKATKDGSYEINGFIGKDKTKLYATKNLNLLFAQSKNIKADGEKGTLIVKINKDDTEANCEESWASSADMFYDKCTKCHAAKVVGDHTMLEWEGLYGSMKSFAKPTKDEDALISRFLKAFAKDGILKEAE